MFLQTSYALTNTWTYIHHHQPHQELLPIPPMVVRSTPKIKCLDKRTAFNPLIVIHLPMEIDGNGPPMQIKGQFEVFGLPVPWYFAWHGH